jgi:hypothetical protein
MVAAAASWSDRGPDQGQPPAAGPSTELPDPKRRATSEVRIDEPGSHRAYFTTARAEQNRAGREHLVWMDPRSELPLGSLTPWIRPVPELADPSRSSASPREFARGVGGIYGNSG